MSESKDNSEETSAAEIENLFLLRPCRVYDGEYSDCTSLKSRFNQYFIFGKTLDCTQWKRDSINCYKWVDDKDVNAAKELIESERKRRRERLLPHYQNTVWEKRRSPPEDWNKPLPEYLQKEYEHTYLNIKSMEMRGEIPPQFDLNVPTSFCTIL